MTTRKVPDFPPAAYAVRKEKPNLKKQVERTLSNYYGRSTQYINIIQTNETFFLKEQKVYYQGSWKRGLPNGVGIAIYQDGSYFEGKFEDGHIQDKDGFLILPNGAYYKGEIEKSLINGQGEMKQDRYFYSGSWLNGKPHGKGRQEYDDDRYYEGNFKHGVKEGKGTYVDKKCLEKYEGDFKEGFMNGHGQYHVNGSLVYEGEFQKGNKVGRGELVTEKGRLKGEFKNDVVNGLGTFEWNDGRIYRGQFVNSKFQGTGEITLKNGNVLRGVWNDGHSDKLTLVPQENVKTFA